MQPTILCKSADALVARWSRLRVRVALYLADPVWAGLASLTRACDGLFLIALPVAIEGYPKVFDAARVPTVLVHGWRDELCPVDDAIKFARARGDILHLVDDSHRLVDHVEYCAEAFRQLLIAID